MKEELFLILGTGQKVLKDINERNYKTAKYYLPENENQEIIETPFVGEAIVRLFKNRFRKVYIFGTDKSMWETLYLHCNRLESEENALDESKVKIFGQLSFAIENGSLKNEEHLLENVAKSFADYTGIETSCHLIPTGETEDEMWGIFDKLINVNVNNAKISFDITHGLRYQPYFLLLALFYLNSVYSTIRIGSVFYGGLELMRSERHKDAAPILEFKLFPELIDWIVASKNFNNYKDFTDLSKLLKNHSDLKKISDLLNNLTLSYKTNNFKKILDYSKQIVYRVNNIENSSSRPFDYLKNSILTFPREIKECDTELERILTIANHQWKQKNYGLVVLALWEAVVEKFAESLGNLYEKQYVSLKLNKIVNKKYESLFNQIQKNLFKNISELKKIRNSIAHLDSSKNDFENLEDFHNKIFQLFNYFTANIEKFNFSPIVEPLRKLLEENEIRNNIKA